MARQIDFLFFESAEQSLSISSLKDNLINCGYNADVCDMDVKSLETIGEVPKFFIADAKYLLAHSVFRMSLYDCCIENDRKIILFGDKEALQNLYNVSVVNVIETAFEYPLNNSDVMEKLKAMVSKFDIKETKKNILVVDDSPTFLRLIAEWLESDYNVSVCPSAAAAFHMISVNKPDLILLDYEMPICNGAQFLEMLRNEPSTADIPVVFLTSKDDAQTVRALITLKPQGYLLKNQPKDKTLHKIAELFTKE